MGGGGGRRFWMWKGGRGMGRRGRGVSREKGGGRLWGIMKDL